ncbi:hypothetical protein COK_0637 [Mannheimia haemolytica serotype A2 str. BOVINE]|nr:hypothetical protein COK_0637 [Mannheimia haemolytica serotype A2 str. BOVINE]
MSCQTYTSNKLKPISPAQKASLMTGEACLGLYWGLNKSGISTFVRSGALT